MIYLDNASTTQVSEKYKQIIDEYLYSSYGNAGSKHPLGGKSKQAIDNARKLISTFFQTIPDNIIFTASGSEANTLAIIGVADFLKSCGKNHIITSKYEHHSVLNAMKKMESLGFDVDYIDVPDGIVNIEMFEKAIRPTTGLVSIMYVNNELGTVNDVVALSRLCKDKKILFHTDCVQAVGTFKLFIDELGVDMISVSGHKIHAPKGIGCLCVKNREILSNIIYGGEQEFGLRPGTENVSYISAFGMAMFEAGISREDVVEKINILSKSFLGELLKLCKNDFNNIGLHVNAERSEKTCKVLSIRFDNIDSETLLLLLGNKGVYVSAGSACSSHSSISSHVLKAIGLNDEQAKSTIRISFSKYNTVEEVKAAAEIFIDCVMLLRKMNKSK
ncbi:MAG: cysteine desulfurase family protein [Clostridia bacterium]|nr:cysteine desulfurase family protein [Clostridia bacterium]